MYATWASCLFFHGLHCNVQCIFLGKMKEKINLRNGLVYKTAAEINNVDGYACFLLLIKLIFCEWLFILVIFGSIKLCSIFILWGKLKSKTNYYEFCSKISFHFRIISHLVEIHVRFVTIFLHKQNNIYSFRF